MIKQILPSWYEVSNPRRGRAWFRTMTECILWLLDDEACTFK